MSESEEESSFDSATDFESSDEDSVDEWWHMEPTKQDVEGEYFQDPSTPNVIASELIKALSKEFPAFYDVDGESEEYDESFFLKQTANRCTYKEGYMKRQNLYTCLDCNRENNQLAALCFGCTIWCHRKHNVIELYSKRNYRCDCGNEKFGPTKCTLYPGKGLFNPKNVYNDNFRGIYCVCKQPYNANSNDENDVMIQCVICEDWFHAKHLDITPPKDHTGKFAFDELICFLCSNRFSYLFKYEQVIASMKKTRNGDSRLTAVVNNISSDNTPRMDSSGIDQSDKSPLNKYDCADVCRIKDIPLRLPYTSLFLPSEWRSYLCQCKECYQIYETNGHLFLLDKDDVSMESDEENDDAVELLNFIIGDRENTPVPVVDRESIMDTAQQPYEQDGNCKPSVRPTTSSTVPTLPTNPLTTTNVTATPQNNSSDCIITGGGGAKSAENDDTVTEGLVANEKSSPEKNTQPFLKETLKNKSPVKLNAPPPSDQTFKQIRQGKHPKYDDNQNL